MHSLPDASDDFAFSWACSMEICSCILAIWASKHNKKENSQANNILLTEDQIRIYLPIAFEALEEEQIYGLKQDWNYEKINYCPDPNTDTKRDECYISVGHNPSGADPYIWNKVNQAHIHTPHSLQYTLHAEICPSLKSEQTQFCPPQ